MEIEKLEKLADRLLERIRNRPGHDYKAKNLAKSLKVKVDELFSAVTILKRLGYVVKTDHKEKLTFVSAPDRLFEEEILHKLKTKKIGRKVYAYQSVQSTNTIAHQLALSRTPEGTIVVAEQQTRGRGRMGRQWYSLEKVGIYLSIVLYPGIDPSLAPGLSLITAVALAETIEKFKIRDVKIKWPNDVLIKKKKTAGILTELSAEIGRTHHVVVGVGINVNQKHADIPEDIKNRATSLRIAARKTISRVEVLREFLMRLEREYNRFKKSGLKAVRKKVLSYSSLIGKEIEIQSGNDRITGKAVDIDNEGHLILETEQGKMILSAGEVTLH